MRPEHTPHPTTRRGPRRANGPRGFTLFELLTTLAIIAILLGILLVGVDAARRAARTAADAATLSGIRQAADAFRREFGFEVPLVFDGRPFDQLPESMRPARARGAGGSFTPVAATAGTSILTVDVTSAAGGSDLYPDGLRALNIYDRGAPDDRAFLRGQWARGTRPVYQGSAASESVSDPRYSKSSLAFYLAGLGQANLDGVEGPGMADPLDDGTFVQASRVVRPGEEPDGKAPAVATRGRHDPFVDLGFTTSRLRQAFLDPVEAREHGLLPPTSADAASQVAITDRNGRGFRYYRWEPDARVRQAGGQTEALAIREPGTNVFGLGRSGTTGQADLNLPPVFSLATDTGSPSDDPTGGIVGLRSARWALVGAGPNRVFGTETIDELIEALDLRRSFDPSSDVDRRELRRLAAEDNIVEVGS